MSNRCLDCGCGMEGGFCSNCHEEVFIAEQYSELGEEVPLIIAQKASEHIDNPERKKAAKKVREKEASIRAEEHRSYFGEPA